MLAHENVCHIYIFKHFHNDYLDNFEELSKKKTAILSVKEVTLITSPTLCLRNLCHMANLQNKNIKYLIKFIFNPENKS